MKILLIQYGLNPMALPAVCGNSGKVYGHAHYNARLGRHEFPMELNDYQEPKTHRDLFNALRRAGCQWFPLFLVPADSSAGELETVKAERDALAAEIVTLKSQVEQKQASIKLHCEDWAEDDTAIKAICTKFGISDCHPPEHNEFKSCVECVEELSAKCDTLTAEIEALKGELIGDEAEAVAGTLPDQKAALTTEALEHRGINYLRKLARRSGHAMTGSPSKASLIKYILAAQTKPEPAAV